MNCLLAILSIVCHFGVCHLANVFHKELVEGSGWWTVPAALAIFALALVFAFLAIHFITIS